MSRKEITYQKIPRLEGKHVGTDSTPCILPETYTSRKEVISVLSKLHRFDIM